MNQKQIALIILGGVMLTATFFSIRRSDAVFQYNQNFMPEDTTRISNDWSESTSGGKTRSKKKKQNRTRQKY
jgi:hypothetical protein